MAGIETASKTHGMAEQVSTLGAMAPPGQLTKRGGELSDELGCTVCPGTYRTSLFKPAAMTLSNPYAYFATCQYLCLFPA